MMTRGEKVARSVHKVMTTVDEDGDVPRRWLDLSDDEKKKLVDIGDAACDIWDALNGHVRPRRQKKTS